MKPVVIGSRASPISTVTADIVLWLDLADANQMAESTVREQVPHGAPILRLTEHGASPCPQGTPAQWPPVLDAIDRLVRKARQVENRSPGCRFWVTGRAGLPAFLYLGYRLSKLAAVTLLHQATNGAAVDAMPLDKARSEGHATPYFSRVPWPVPRSEAAAPVALVVSCLRYPEDRQVHAAMAERGAKAAGIVRAHADARLDARTIAPATQELDELIRASCDAHPARSTLAVFVAGPSSLAFLVGAAIHPRACRELQVFEFDGSRYALAYELPCPQVPGRNGVQFLAASPASSSGLALDEEIRGATGERRFHDARDDPRPAPASDLSEPMRPAGPWVRLQHAVRRNLARAVTATPSGSRAGARHPLQDGHAPAWAVSWGEDRHGVFAAFAVGPRGQRVEQRMRWIPPGRFLMGSPVTERGRFSDEGPQHEVILTRGYWLGETPVTQALWVAVMGDNPSHFRGEDLDDLERPVEQVSWDDCQAFLGRLDTQVTGLAARLPTEAEWEHACRGRTTGATWAGELSGDEHAPELDAIAWYGGNSGGETHAVGRKAPNPYGLHDMLGNVWEWCEDTAEDIGRPYRGSDRVYRGGSWRTGARRIRAARHAYHRGYRGDDLGFRLAGGRASEPR